MDNWKTRKRPLRLEGRFEFQSYENTRDFLDSLSSLSEKIQKFPDISFGKTYVNITIRPENDLEKDFLPKEDHDFAESISSLLP